MKSFVRPAVRVFDRNPTITGRRKRKQRIADRRHAVDEGVAASGPLISNLVFKGGNRGIGVAALDAADLLSLPNFEPLLDGFGNRKKRRGRLEPVMRRSRVLQLSRAKPLAPKSQRNMILWESIFNSLRPENRNWQARCRTSASRMTRQLDPAIVVLLELVEKACQTRLSG
jgi:hypothetical protein